MRKPDPERAELSKQWRIWMQGIDEDFDNVPGAWLRAFAPQVLEVSKNGPELVPPNRATQRLKDDIGSGRSR